MVLAAMPSCHIEPSHHKLKFAGRNLGGGMMHRSIIKLACHHLATSTLSQPQSSRKKDRLFICCLLVSGLGDH